jgi:hypothetical protein
MCKQRPVTLFPLTSTAYFRTNQPWRSTPSIWELHVFSTLGCAMPTFCFRPLFHLLTVAIGLIVSKVVWIVTHLLSFHQTKTTSPWHILVVRCTLFFLLQIFYLLKRAVSNTILSYGAGCSIPKTSKVHQNVTVVEKLSKKTQWLLESSSQAYWKNFRT